MKVGVFDICVAAIVAVVIVLPGRGINVAPAFDEAHARGLGEYQARVAADPTDGAAVEALVERLLEVKQSDWALRTAGESAQFEDSPTHWRTLLSISSVHADRVEIRDAYEFADKAMAACDAPGASCPPDERVRMSMYLNELGAGVSAIRSGIDPRVEPEKFRKEIQHAYPRARLDRKRHQEMVEPPAPDKTDGRDGSPAPTP